MINTKKFSKSGFVGVFRLWRKAKFAGGEGHPRTEVEADRIHTLGISVGLSAASARLRAPASSAPEVELI